MGASPCATPTMIRSSILARFFADNLAQLLRFPPHSWTFSIILPLGISFHTFQSISYVVDVYRGEQKAIRNPIDYALFIAFFPQLVAGPIVRAEEFFADLFAWKHPSQEEVAARRACWSRLA